MTPWIFCFLFALPELASGTSSHKNSDDRQVRTLFQENFCQRESAPKASDQYSTEAECNARCNQVQGCRGFEMVCGVKCELLSECDNLYTSSCHSFVALDRNIPINAAGTNGDTRLSNVVFVSLVFSAFGALVLQVESADVSANYKPRGGHSRTSFHWQASVDERYQHLFTLLLKASLPLVVVTLLSSWYPTFPHGGICGLANEDKTAIWFNVLTPFKYFVIDSHAHLVPALHKMPNACWSVLHSDIVTNVTGPSCAEWCQQIIADIPRPWCEYLPLAGLMFKVCNKVEIWTWARHIQTIFGYISFKLVVLIVYSLVSVCQALWKYSHLSVEYIANNVRGTHYSRASTMARPAYIDEMPNQTEISRDGPFFVREGAKWGWLPPPACCIPVSTDACGAQLATVVKFVGVLGEPVADINLALVFLFNGEFWYSAAMAVAVLLPNLHDPFQSEILLASWLSIEQGYEVKDLYRYQRREGISEGVWSLIIALHSLMRTGYYVHVVDRTTLWSMWTVVFLCTMHTIPQAAVASHLLLKIKDFRNFYVVAMSKPKSIFVKIMPSLDAFALAVAVGRTFPASFLLGVALWVAGVTVGIPMAFLIYRLQRDKSNPPEAKPKTLIALLLSFFCWPCSVTRLGGTPEVWQNICQGVNLLPEPLTWTSDEGEDAQTGSQRTSIIAQSMSETMISSLSDAIPTSNPSMASDACLYGLASSPPVVYYTHRVMTLAAYWTFTAISPIHRSFYVQLWEDVVVHWHNVQEAPLRTLVNNTRGRVILSILLILGWIALILQFVIFFCLKSQMADDYGRMKPRIEKEIEEEENEDNAE